MQNLNSIMDLHSFEKVVNELKDIKPRTFVNFPITSTIRFGDNLWIFEEFKRFHGEDFYYKYDFTDLDTTYKDYAKYMVIRELFVKRNRFITVKPKFQIIRDFISYLTDNRIFHPEIINVNNLKEFLKYVPSERDLAKKKGAIKNFLAEIELRISGINFSELYNYLNEINSRKIQIERKEGKHKFVPIDLHNKLISLAIKDLRNESLRPTQRAAACMIVILAETGMRIGEFRVLEVDMLDELRVKGESKTFYFLNFKTFKTVKEKEYKWTRTFLTDNALHAYETLTELFKDRRNTEFLFVKQNGTGVSKTLLRFRLVEFFYRHKDTLQLNKVIDHEINQFSVTRKRNLKSAKFIPDEEMDKDIYYITFHQYRVVLATILYHKDYPLDFIRKHMNHLTEEMTKHYIRIEEMKKLEANAVETLQKRSSKDGSALISSPDESLDNHIIEELHSRKYQDIYEQINRFLKKNKLNIFKDINEIVAKLSRTDIPIADMELGICAKSFTKLCERNEYISSINDAYYIGVQIHSLEDLPYSFKRFQEKSSIIAYNENLYLKNPKYLNEYERELKGIQKYIKRKLGPEIMLLQEKIEEIGDRETHIKYPGLTGLIEDFSNIKKEVKKWTEKTL